MESGLQLGFFILLLLLTVPLLGRYMAEIFKDNPQISIPILGTLEKLIYHLCKIDPAQEMGWKDYAKGMLYFNLVGFIFLFCLQIFQGWLPLNPQGFQGVGLALAFNTAISFVTNTNWQAYGGENTMSYLTQMAGLTVQNFVSAATGNAVLLAHIRGLVRTSSQTIGNFWVDLTRTIIYLFLPFCIILAFFLVSQGVIQNIHPYVQATTLQGDIQNIPMGPAASQVAIKQLGTNGGGFFNANSAHPFENPTPLSNFVETFAILCIPAAATYMYGMMIKSRKQGWLIFFVMFIIWIGGIGIAIASEYVFNPVLAVNPVLEGKETRFGVVNSVFWAVSTTATSSGSINSMHSSLSPLTGGIAMFNMEIGEVVFGGVGVGMCSMLMFIFLTMFLVGLMVGRTPEYLGKKIEKTEMQWVMLAILTPCSLILLGSGIAIALPVALDSLANFGPHGLSEILYAFSSAANNNGSAFAGIGADTLFYNIVLGKIMLLGRLSILVPSLAIAGSLAQKKTVAYSLGTFPTNNPLFGVLLFSVILIVAALTFFPALSLGPIVEQILMLRGQAF
ncbi:MAG: potassium-transporting ATPase subunit KdpA [Parachlamydiaceae bacterium]|nr:potassium-transporting ATPase subunit KdpA [Parachlamydiaceae bacterium]